MMVLNYVWVVGGGWLWAWHVGSVTRGVINIQYVRPSLSLCHSDGLLINCCAASQAFRPTFK